MYFTKSLENKMDECVYRTWMPLLPAKSKQEQNSRTEKLAKSKIELEQIVLAHSNNSPCASSLKQQSTCRHVDSL
jgi:hypothetical protein